MLYIMHICHILLSFPNNAVTSREQTTFLVGGRPPASGLPWQDAAVGLLGGSWTHTGLQVATYHRNTQARLPWPCRLGSRQAKSQESCSREKKEKLNLSKNIVPVNWQGQGQIGLRVV